MGLICKKKISADWMSKPHGWFDQSHAVRGSVRAAAVTAAVAVAVATLPTSAQAATVVTTKSCTTRSGTPGGQGDTFDVKVYWDGPYRNFRGVWMQSVPYFNIYGHNSFGSMDYVSIDWKTWSHDYVGYSPTASGTGKLSAHGNLGRNPYDPRYSAYYGRPGQSWVSVEAGRDNDGQPGCVVSLASPY